MKVRGNDEGGGSESVGFPSGGALASYRHSEVYGVKRERDTLEVVDLRRKVGGGRNGIEYHAGTFPTANVPK